jgi:hypothetical protein
VLVEAALSWAGQGHAPLLELEEGFDEHIVLDGVALTIDEVFDRAGLTKQEARAWKLYCAGFSYATIGRFMDRSTQAGIEEPLAKSTVQTYIDRGRAALNELVRNGDLQATVLRLATNR